MTYQPRPLDTSGVELSAALNDLVESLAANNHDNWALQRITDGWRFGPNRDDDAKTHPDLVPYEELPESEKKYDRRTVIETLKAIIGFGYMIEEQVRRG